MILSKEIEKIYHYSIKKIKNSKTNIEKRLYVESVIGNLKELGYPFTVRQLSKILGVSRKLVRKVLDLFDTSKTTEEGKLETRGRKKVEDKYPEIINQIKQICENFEHVDKSLKDEVVYIDITLTGIKEKLISEYNYSKENCPCENTIRRILIKKLNYKITKIKKNKVYKKIPETNLIFENVAKKKMELNNSDESIIGISIDDKATKYVGLLSDGGKSWKEKIALDHDTNPNYIIKPFGIMDIKTKRTFVYCTTSSSTADYKVDCIEEYLILKLKKNPNIKKLLIFLDNGPENSSRRKLWMYRIIMLSKKYNIIIELVYYPPYHSKYNLIEHFWGVLQKHWSGLIIDTLEKLIGAINSCNWSKVSSKGFLRMKEYNKGVKVDEKLLNELKEKHIVYENQYIKKWSIIINP